MSALVRLLRTCGGASAAEFALILPLLILLLLGIIDAGRFMWNYNQAEKATQMGVRYAVATALVPSGMESYSFSIDGGIIQGRPVPTSSFDRAICDDSDCDDCTPGGGLCSAIGYNSAAFVNIVDWMNNHYGPIAANNVEIEYRNIGLGYAGDPAGSDVAPLVTVRLVGLNFQPITTLFLGATIAMPNFSAALTLEDGSGAVSN